MGRVVSPSAVDAGRLVIGASALALLLMCASAISGCGGGVSSPGTTTITGRLVDAGDPSQPVGNAYVYVPATGAQALMIRQDSGNVAETHADPDGYYTLSDVPVGPQVIHVEPEGDSGYADAEVEVDVPDGAELELQLTMVSAEMAARIDRIAVRPTTATVAFGGRRLFTADALDVAGNNLGLTPTWTLTAGLGTIGATGILTAGQREVQGAVVATFGPFSGIANVTVSATDGGNTPPLIRTMTADPPTVAPGGIVELTCDAVDIDNDTLTFAWDGAGGALDDHGDGTATWTAPQTEGQYNISCTVDDGNGGTDTLPVQVTVSISGSAHPPVIRSLTAAPANLNPSETTTLACDAVDQHGDALTFTWDTAGGIFTGSGATVTWRAPETEGTYVISCTVDDGFGGTDSATVVVRVRSAGFDVIVQ